MSYSTVLVEREHGIATVTLNRPDKLNALNTTLLRDLGQVWSELGQDGELRVAILTGRGKAFVAGADIEEMSRLSPPEARQFAELGQHVGQQMESCPLPIIAAVNGFALGGGTELALCADFVFAADTAKFGQPEVGLGLIPGFGGTQRLPRLVGSARARELIYSGEIIDAASALALGLVNRVLPAGELLAQTRRVAERIASRSPLAVATAKRVIGQSSDGGLARGLEIELTAFASLFGSDDQREGLSAFLEKRPPSFSGK